MTVRIGTGIRCVVQPCTTELIVIVLLVLCVGLSVCDEKCWPIRWTSLVSNQNYQRSG